MKQLGLFDAEPLAAAPAVDLVIRGLSLTQPWASLVAYGEKEVETRSWPCGFRGWVAIHAAKGMDVESRQFCLTEPAASVLRKMGVNPDLAQKQMPRGAIVAIAEIYDVQYMGDWDNRLNTWVQELSAQERAFGGYSGRRWGFFLRNVVRLEEPIPCNGALGLWEIPEEMKAMLCQLIDRGIAE